MSEFGHHQSAEELSTNESFPIDVRDSRRLERKAQARRRLPIKMAATALSLSLVTTAYWHDVESNKQHEAEAQISFNLISEANDPQNNDALTLFIDGFNAYDADYLTAQLGPGAQQDVNGELWSLSTNNASLNRDAIYDSIVQLAQERHKTNISIVGYSVGGIIATEAMADICAKSNITPNKLRLISTPTDFDTIRPQKKDELDGAEWLFKTIPGATHSSWLRLAGEVYSYQEAYTQNPFEADSVMEGFNIFANNITTFGDTVQHSFDQEMNNPRRASIQLLSQQVDKIATANIQAELTTIATCNDSIDVAYFGTAEPGFDHVVDDKLAAHRFGQYSLTAGIAYNTFYVTGAQHSEYFQTIDAYNQTFAEAATKESKQVDDKFKH